MASGKIFISYRREDTSGESGRLKDKLEQVFGQENIFYDVETLEAGLNFDESIAKALGESKVLLAMIGPHWLKVVDAKGIARLQKPDDWVRKEIAEALKRELRVIPVLVNGAEMPDPEDLPQDLQQLSLKHAQELTSSRWNYDVGELTKVLEKIITKKQEPKPDPQPIINPKPRPFVPPVSQPKSWWAKNYLWMIGSLVGILILVGLCTPDEEYINPVDQDLITRDQLVQDAETLVETSPNQDPRVTNPEGNEIYESLTLDTEQNRPADAASILIIYTGDNYGCVLGIEITIGDVKIIPTGNQFTAAGIPSGNQRYTIGGQIACPTAGNCMVSGEGVIKVSQGTGYYVVWQNTGQGQCTMVLQAQ